MVRARRRTQAEIESQERFEQLEKTIADLTTLVQNLQQNQPPAPPPQPPPQVQPPPVPPPQQQAIPVPQQIPPPVQNENQNAPQNLEPQAAPGLNLKEFLKLKPPTFEGGINPAIAYEWLAETKKIFKVMECSATQKVRLASYKLKGEAYRWWNLKDKAEPGMEWRRFLVVFKEKYIPQAVRDAKCSEFLELKQKRPKTVADYEAEFTNLAKFGSHVIDTDSRKARKFEDGLIPEIRNIVRPLRLATYADVLDRALIAEQGLEDVRRISEFKKRKNENGGKKSGYDESKRQNTGETIPTCIICGKLHSGVCWRTTQGSHGKNLPTCDTCGKMHSGVCWRTLDRCFSCGQSGHIQRDCPRRVSGANAVPLGNSGKPTIWQGANTSQKTRANQKPAKAFALTPGDPCNTESEVEGASGLE